MDIGKYDVKFGSPVLITLAMLLIIPSSSGYIDCRISCRRCQKNTEHPAVLEVYCAMCKECKQRRRERILGRSSKVQQKIKLPTVRMRDGIEVTTDNEALMMRPQEALQLQEGDQDMQADFLEHQQGFQQPESLQQLENYQLQEQEQPEQLQQMQPMEHQQLQPLLQAQELTTPKILRGVEYPPGCPTPPICPDSQEVGSLSASVPTATPMQITCPPVTGCIKRPVTPVTQVSQICIPVCMPMWPMCNFTCITPAPTQQLPLLKTEPMTQSTQSTTTQGYNYVYIGLPKGRMPELIFS